MLSRLLGQAKLSCLFMARILLPGLRRVILIDASPVSRPHAVAARSFPIASDLAFLTERA